VDNPKDRGDQYTDMARQEFQGEDHRPIEAPSGLDLHPEPKKAVRVSKRTSVAVIAVGAALLLVFAYGGYRRSAKAQIAARQAGLPKSVVPATQAETEFTTSIPSGTVPLAHKSSNGLQPPDQTDQPDTRMPAPCGTDPQTHQHYRYNPTTGQPCDGFPEERVVVRQAPVTQSQALQPPAAQGPPSTEEQQLIAAYQREQEAKLAPTGVRVSGEPSTENSSFRSPASSLSSVQPGASDLSRIAALNRALTGDRDGQVLTDGRARSVANDNEYDQNMQARKEAFLSQARTRETDDYLRSTREAPLSRYEIKAGWEIPAVLEQSLNSDLPGELKALVTANVYDTATGMYLLIPQGSRLIGKYDSRISYGQDGVQVAWNRIIYPDASSVDLDGMVGLDSHGNAGLRDKVDHHYKRLIGFSALTSMFTAAFAVSQRTNQNVLAYPSPGQVASQAVGQELSQTGAQITRRNLNVQPTVKVPVGYKFTVRVNRDILFEEPYQPMQANSQQGPNGNESIRQSSLQSNSER
jgi:type IV secretion system protein VirB10